MKKRFIFLTTDKSRQSQSTRDSRLETPVIKTPSYDCDTLIGLLLLFGLTGLATFSMVVDVTAMTQAFRPESPSPVESQYEVAKLPSVLKRLQNSR